MKKQDKYLTEINEFCDVESELFCIPHMKMKKFLSEMKNEPFLRQHLM